MNSNILFIYRIISFFIPETRFFKLKNWILRKAGIIIGSNVRICSSVNIIGNGNLIIGNNSWIGPNSFISSSYPALIKIGDNVDIAPLVYIGTGTHEIDMIGLNSAGVGRSYNIEIGNGVWVCAGAIILPGVKIGTKAIIAAGSIVNKDVKNYTIVAGNPIKVFKEFYV